MKRLSLLLLIGFSLAACKVGVEDAALESISTRIATTMTVDPSLVPTPTLLPQLADITPSPTSNVPPTSTAMPTATPSAAERIELGESYLEQENFDAAAREFQISLSNPRALNKEQQEKALYGLSMAYQNDSRFEEAIDAFNRFLNLSSTPSDASQPSHAAAQEVTDRQLNSRFHLAEAHRQLGDCQSAINEYEAFLSMKPELAAYVQTRIAQCYLQLGNTEAAVAAYEAAVSAPAHRLTEIETRETLAEIYLNAENYAAVVAQYDAIHDLAETENTRGLMTYLAATTQLKAGNFADAYERFLKGVNQYPRAYESYLGLVALIEAGQNVDHFQRGLVDYYGKAYEPAIGAFASYMQANPTNYRADVHLYLAWSYEALGNLNEALAQIDAYAQYGATETGAPNAPEAGIERAELYTRAGQISTAIDTYLTLVNTYPQSREAREAIWNAATLAHQQGDLVRAQQLYRQLAETYPGHEEASRALFRAGMIAWRSNDNAGAIGTWRHLGDNYAQSEFGAAGLVWLMNTLPEEEAEPYVVTATQLSGVTYYALRASELARGIEPFERTELLDLSADEWAERAAAEAWLADSLGLDPTIVSSELSPEIAQDPRIVRGEALWAIGLYPEAKRELEAVRVDYARDAVASYQLALYFSELGLYRSSIIAADTVLALLGTTIFEAPRLIGRLSYPVYYADLILPLAEQYGYDPLLQFALVRQESLFESFISSYVGAQGLSQVMPATGDYIAQRLGWEGYANEQLFRPHVGLAFGAYYLGEQLNRFDGDVYAALSAYNAGPGNAARWHEAAGDNPDLYLETVDYSETRLYIQRIYKGYAIYRYLYGSE